MKKKIIAIALIIAMMSVTFIGGTLAYFADSDEAVNTFTVGNVSIDLEEKEEDNTTDYTDDDKVLNPGDEPTAKRAWVKNTGENDAWVWVEILIPAALDNKDDASQNSLHFNYYGQFMEAYYDDAWASSYASTPINDGILNADHSPAIDKMVAVADGLWLLDEEVGAWTDEDTGVAYNVYTFKMEKTLAAGATSLPVLRQVYMDAAVEQCDDDACENGEGCLILKDGSHYDADEPWEVIVKAYAMQQEGFTDVDAAIEAYEAQQNNG